MGNRGTTPSWDEEEIAKWGLFAHLDFTARRLRSYDRRNVRRELIATLHKILEAKKKLESESTQD